mgnify:CR=1 FL=1
MSKISYVTRKLSQIAKITTGSTPSTGDETNFSDEGVCWVKPDNLRGLNGVSQVKQKISAKGMLSMSMVRKGSVLVNCIGDVGKIGVADIDLVTNQQINSISFNNSLVDDRYGAYMILASEDEAKSEANSVVVPILNKGNQSNIKYTFPESVELQKSIATYLDRKVGVIDKIITTKNHTHTHLLELRQAIITDAILGRGGVGVNYRQTNIPWIGKIPAHWQVRKIKHVANIVLGKMLQSTEKEGYQYKKYLRAQNIRWEEVSIESVNKMWFSPRELSFCRLKEGDILVSEGGEVGRAAMWRNELSECYIQNSVNRLRVSESVINPKYLLYVIEGIGQAKVFENTVNRVSIAHLTREKLKEYSIPLPPLNEQRAIVKGIEESLRKIDKSVNGLQKSIDLLTEYRSSLISNVINGKVKV